MNQFNKFLFTSAGIFVCLGALLIVQSHDAGKVRLIFCDVGQGDGILLITPSGKQVVVDGGPGSKILDCLGENMPFSDRSIDMIIATHAQKDHMEGLLSVLERYDVSTIVSNGVGQDSNMYAEWERLSGLENAKIVRAKAGDQFVLEPGQSSLMVLWPTQERLDHWSVDPPSDLNETSYVMRLEFGENCAYLTGDIPKEILETVIDRPCDILKIAHHGSKTGTNEKVLDLAKPKTAIIQVGKNSYGHPTKEVLDLLEQRGIKILRNDLLGTIELE